MSPWRPARLTAAQREERRRAAAAQFPKIRRGQLSQAHLARDLGVCRSAVNQWYAAWRVAGPRALRRRPRRGRPPKLGAAQWRALKRLIARGALAAGFPTEQWTLRRIAQLIRREFGVAYHFRYLARPLRAHGITLQQPVVQARERSEALVRAWLTRDWDAVKKRLAASGASLPSWMRQVTRFGPR